MTRAAGILETTLLVVMVLAAGAAIIGWGAGLAIVVLALVGLWRLSERRAGR